jgi:hypothetical protein
MAKENIISLYIDSANDMFVTFWDNFNVGGVGGDFNDIMIIHPDDTVTKFWDGNDYGFTGRIHGLHIRFD